MPFRYVIQRQRKAIAGLLVAIAVALAWISVTPAGALSCLHCFLAQRWVEATVSAPVRQQSWVDTEPDRLIPAPTLTAADHGRHVPRLSADRQGASASGKSSPAKAWTAIVPLCSCRTRQAVTAYWFGDSARQFVAGPDSTILRFRAPPSLIAT